MQHHVVEVTPTISTSQYSAGDQVGTLMTLSGAVPGERDGAVLRQVTVVDKAKQKAALTVYLFDASPTVASSDNAAADVADAEMADKCLGKLAVAAGDYSDLSANSTATVAPGVWCKAAAGTALYALAVTSGTPTYGAVSDLVFRFHFSWE